MQGYENEVLERLERWRMAQREALRIDKVEMMPSLSDDEIKEIKGKHKTGR